MKKREVELDVLRIIALFCVLTIHCMGMNMGGAGASVPKNGFFTIIGSLITWQIPIYVMISGRFFLDPEIYIQRKKLIHSIVRIVVAFIVWNVIYQTFYYLTGAYENLNWKGVLTEAVLGPYHFWFLFMIVGLYLVVPLLRMITASKKHMEYFILLFFIVSAINGYAVEIPALGPIIAEIMRKTNIHLVVGFSGYYVLGCYLKKYSIPDRWEKILYALAAILLTASTIATVAITKTDRANKEMFVEYLKPNIIIVAAAIFTFFTKRVSRCHFSDKAVHIITKLSEYSFGIYLIHALVADALGKCGLSTAFSTPALILPVAVILTFVISLTITALLRLIPRIGRFIT